MLFLRSQSLQPFCLPLSYLLHSAYIGYIYVIPEGFLVVLSRRNGEKHVYSILSEGKHFQTLQKYVSNIIELK